MIAPSVTVSTAIHLPGLALLLACSRPPLENTSTQSDR